MSNFAIKRIEDMEAVYTGAFKRARAELGVTSFGLQVIDFPANADAYPEHDHAEDGQEEVYLPLDGSGDIDIDGQRHPLEPGTLVRVGPDVKRKITTRDQTMRLLAIGGVPGKGYSPPEFSKLGAPDPLQDNG